jgi:hypothetical protein
LGDERARRDRQVRRLVQIRSIHERSSPYQDLDGVRRDGLIEGTSFGTVDATGILISAHAFDQKLH